MRLLGSSPGLRTVRGVLALSAGRESPAARRPLPQKMTCGTLAKRRTSGLETCLARDYGYDASMSTTGDGCASVAPWLAGGGMMGELVRQHDWAGTPLGPIESWPAALRSLVGLVLQSRQPMFLWWGAELIQIYNDAYVPSFGVGKHPSALGQRGRACWSEIWHIIGPQIEGVLAHGAATWHEDALVPILRNGKLEDVYWTYGYSPAFDDTGSIAGVLVVCTETTSRVEASRREVEARKALELERARLYAFFEQAPAAICILRGPDLTFEFVNTQYQHLAGRLGITGKPLLEALPELAGQGFDDLLRKVMATNEVFLGKEVLVKLAAEAGDERSFQEIYCTFIYSPLRDSLGVTDGVIAFVLDVTDQVMKGRRADALALQVQRSDAEFRTLAESMPQLAWSAQPDGFIDWYNRRWYEYTGTVPADMEGWGWQSVHDPALIETVMERWKAALAEGADFEMEFPLRRGDGVFRWHLTRAVPLRDEAGNILRWFGTNTDIDDARRASTERAALLIISQGERERAEAANRAKDEFLATASHELRTPLNAILGWARLLRGGQLDEASKSRGVEVIERNARAQIRLIEDILDASRIITGKLQIESVALDIEELVQRAVDTVRPAAAAKKISVTVRLEARSLIVLGDPERLQQVVWNLVSNAIKFTPAGGTVEVTLSPIGSQVELRVADTGQGIPLDFLPYVFERFRQAESSSARGHGGLGLGLALVRHLVEAHGGSVRAESAGSGQGATFTCRLPVHALDGTGPQSHRRMSGTQQPLELASVLLGVTILVVDDEQDARELVGTVLQACGAIVTLARNAEAAVEALRRHMPSTLISDVGMPDTDGYELMRRIRREFGEAGMQLPALALTAYAREEDRRRSRQAGFDLYIAKPVEPSDLVAAVVQILSGTSGPALHLTPSGRPTLVRRD